MSNTVTLELPAGKAVVDELIRTYDHWLTPLQRTLIRNARDGSIRIVRKGLRTTVTHANDHGKVSVEMTRPA